MLHVPGRFPSIAGALAAIAASPPPPGTRVEIRVADGLYRLTETIRLNLDIGKDVHLLGNAAEPRRCVLEWAAPKVDGLVVSDGHMFGLVDGFTIRKPAKAEWPDNYSGILALRNSRLRIGPHVVVENWYYGAAARVASTLWCDGLQVHNAGDVGIWSYRRSTVFAAAATSTGAWDALNGWGFGFQAEYDSTLDARGAHAEGCLKAGFAALSGSRAKLPGCVAERNEGSGFLVREGGTIVAAGATAQSNLRYGAEIDGVGTLSGLRINRDNGLGQVGHSGARAASVPARKVAD